MNILELIIMIILCYFAGYGFATWQEDQERDRKERRNRRLSFRDFRNPRP